MSWQEFILLQTLFAAVSVVTLRILARDRQTAKASFVINAGLYVTLYLSGLVFLPWLGKFSTHADIYWWRFLGGGLAFALTNVCTYKTLVYFDAALASIVGTVNAFFTVIGSTLVLNEDLTALQVVGSFVLLLAITYAVLATRTGPKKLSWQSAKFGTLFAVLAGLFYAAAIVNEKSLLGHMSLASYTVFGWGGQMLVSVLAAIVVQPKALKLLIRPRVAGLAAVSGVLRGLAGICFMFSEIKSNNVGLVTVISNFKIIIVVLMGWWLLKERQKVAQKLESALAAIAGLSIMFWH